MNEGDDHNPDLVPGAMIMTALACLTGAMILLESGNAITESIGVLCVVAAGILPGLIAVMAHYTGR